MTARPARLGAAVLAALLTGLLTVVGGVSLAAPVRAVTVAAPQLRDATARAEQLRAKVDKLATAAEVASEDYAESQAQLAQVMTRHLVAQRQLREAKHSSANDSSIADDRVRAIYITNGKAGMLSGVLGAHDLGDLAARMHTMDNIVNADQAAVAAGARVTRQAAAIETQLRLLSAQKLALQKRSETAADRVRAALSASRKLLVAADATVKRLAEQKRAAEAAAAARAFAAQLSAARAGAALLDLGPNVAPSAVAAAAVAAARTRLGSPYVWGATGPDSFDCSGLTGWAYRKAGLTLPRTSRQQWYAGRRVGLAGLAPGDLLFWATNLTAPASIHHVAIYTGGGMMIAAPQAGDVVKVQAVYSNGYIGAVRPRA